MGTKLRSACDRCHESKVRCNGEIPCQGCSAARRLCFYSLSSPLGRPRGTTGRKARSRATARRTAAKVEKESTRRIADNGDADRRSLSCDDGDQLFSNETQNTFSRLQHSLGRQREINQDDNIISSSFQRPSAIQRSQQVIPQNRNLFDVDAITAAQDFTGLGPTSLMSPNIRQPYVEPAMTRMSTTILNNSQVAADAAQPTPDPHFLDFGHETSTLEGTWAVPTVVNDVADTVCPTPGSIDDEQINVAISVKVSRKTNSVNPKQFLMNDQVQMFTESNDSIGQFFLPVGSSATLPKLLDDGVQSVALSVVDSALAISPMTDPPFLTCHCLQQHAELISNIETSHSLLENIREPNIRLDTTLSLLKQGTEAWQSLVGCPYCPYRRDQGVMFLALIAIRAVMKHLGQLIRGTSVRKDYQVQDLPTLGPLHGLDATRVTVGSVELGDEERSLISRLLIRRALNKIKDMLQSLQTIQERRKEHMTKEAADRAVGEDDYRASSSLLQTQQMIHALVNSLQTLEITFEHGDIT